MPILQCSWNYPTLENNFSAKVSDKSIKFFQNLEIRWAVLELLEHVHYPLALTKYNTLQIDKTEEFEFVHLNVHLYIHSYVNSTNFINGFIRKVPVRICRRICVSVVRAVWYNTQILHTFWTSAESTRFPPTGFKMFRTDADFWNALLNRSNREEFNKGFSVKTGWIQTWWH